MIPHRPFQRRFAFLAVALAALPAAFLPAQERSSAPADAAVLQTLRQRIDGQRKGVAIVVGCLDGDGAAPRVIPYGRTVRDGRVAADARTVFEIGSVSKVFTGLLLAIAVEKGEVKLDDPLEKHLPPGTKVPTCNGRQITLLDLATHRSGLPRLPDNVAPKDPANPYADYTFDQLQAFLAGHTLARDIGAQYEYSNLGAGVLGQGLAHRAGKTYEQLVSERIFGPLGMKSTAVTLTPDEQSRLAAPYDAGLSPVKNWDMGLFAGAGGIRSDVEDMLKFAAAQLDPASTPLAAAITLSQKVQAAAGGPTMDMGLGWHIDHADKARDPIVWHNGATGGYCSFLGLDPTHHRAVVVLSNTGNSVDDIGSNLLHASP